MRNILIVAGGAVAVVAIAAAVYFGTRPTAPSAAPVPVAAASSDAKSLLNVQPGDHVMGDLKAPITMIEYASLTCPHCAHFNTTELPQIEDKWIKTGKVRLIYRDFPLDQIATKAATSHCRAPGAMPPTGHSALPAPTRPSEKVQMVSTQPELPVRCCTPQATAIRAAKTTAMAASAASNGINMTGSCPIYHKALINLSYEATAAGFQMSILDPTTTDAIDPVRLPACGRCASLPPKLCHSKATRPPKDAKTQSWRHVPHPAQLTTSFRPS